MGNPFLGPSKRQASANPFVGGGSNPFLSGGKKEEDVEARLDTLEQQAADLGARSHEQDSPGLFRRAVDILSRPNYAIAGAAEELFTQQGGGGVAALKRAGREFFSGIGGLKGDKEGFGQVMEQAGVGELGSLSSIAPDLFSDTGEEWLKLRKGGFFDITGRGTAGLVLDVALDPTTYLTAGTAKGIGIGGKAIPGSARALQAVELATKSTIKSVPAFDKALDAVGGVFNRDWKIRNLPGAIRLKQAHLNRQNYEKSLLYDQLENSAVAAIPKNRRAEFVDAMDDGSWATKYADDPKMLQAAQEFKALNESWAKKEVDAALLSPESVRENYVAHFYENSPEELSTALSLWPGGSRINKDTLGRHAELRAFDTLKQAEEWSRAQHALDAAVPILKPLRDPLEILKRRGDASIEALEFQRYYDEIRATFARADVPFNAEDYFDLTKAIPVNPGEAARIDELVKAGKTSLDEFGKLSEAGKREFMRNRLLRAKEPGEVVNILRKYGEGNAPKQKRLVGTLAEDGTPYKSVRLGKHGMVELPESLVNDLQEMSERVIKSRDLDHLLRWYDRANNTFKSFVTVMFPAFHFRNAYSNLAQGFADVGMSVLNPDRHYDAYAALKGLNGELVTKTGERIPYAALREEMAKNGILSSGRRMLEYTGTQGLDRLSTVGGKIKAAPRAVGGAIENEARAALYTVYRRRGMDAASAAERVNQFLFDYTNLSRVEQDFFRRMIPFYTFTRKNLERQFRNILTKPGYTATQVKAFRGREDENGMLTSWDGEALKLRLNRDGKTLRILSGVDLPIRNLDMIWNGSLRGTGRQAVGMLSPILKAPLELSFGVQAFTGKEMTRQQSNLVGRGIELLDPPAAVKNWMGYKKDNDAAGRPRYTFDGERFYILFQSWALSRLVSTTDRQFRTYTDDPDVSRVLLDVFTGLRDKELNLDEEQAKRVNERVRQLEQSLQKRGAMNEYRKTYAPKRPGALQ